MKKIKTPNKVSSRVIPNIVERSAKELDLWRFCMRKYIIKIKVINIEQKLMNNIFFTEL
jgi:hypothetical protein